MIKKNGDRYCKNPYFLHSLCTQNGPSIAYGDSAYNSKHPESRTISHSNMQKGRRNFIGSSGSGAYIGEDGMQPPRIRKKIRPQSAPKHQAMRSQGLKQKI